MKIFSCKHTIANAKEHPIQYKAGMREWRWVFCIEKYYIGFFEQVKSIHPGWYDMHWRDIHGHYYVEWNTEDSKWGRFHDYYDGPLNSFCLGRLQFHWA